MTWWMIGAGWIACAVLASGIEFADEQRRFPSIVDWRADLTWWLGICLLFGPAALLGSLITTGFARSGWTWRVRAK